MAKLLALKQAIHNNFVALKKQYQIMRILQWKYIPVMLFTVIAVNNLNCKKAENVVHNELSGQKWMLQHPYRKVPIIFSTTGKDLKDSVNKKTIGSYEIVKKQMNPNEFDYEYYNFNGVSIKVNFTIKVSEENLKYKPFEGIYKGAMKKLTDGQLMISGDRALFDSPYLIGIIVTPL